MRKKRLKVVTETYTGKPFRTHALLIGQTVLAWNGLHENLGLIFWEAIRDETGAPMKIWQSSILDRPKRKMLEAVVPYMTLRWRVGFPKLLPDLKWLLDETEKLEDHRNNVVHAPLALLRQDTSIPGLSFPPVVVPLDFHGNRRAERLTDKDLLAEYRWCRDTANALSHFAKAVRISLVVPQYAWPDRPRLPARKQKTAPRHRQSGS